MYIVYTGGSLPRKIKEFIILQSSINNCCQFCIDSHIDIAKGLGISEYPIRMLQDTANLKPEYACAIVYLNSIFDDSNCISDSMFDDLNQYFTEPEIVQLTTNPSSLG